MASVHAQVMVKLRQKAKGTDKVQDESAELFVKLQAVQEQIGKLFQLTILHSII